MHLNRPADDSKTNSGPENDPFDLNLPEVQPGQEPLPLIRPTYEQTKAHAMALIRAGWDDLRHRPPPNSTPFQME